jgi:pyruvate dehydrogenase E1 component
LQTPRLESFAEFIKGSGSVPASTTKSFVRLLSTLLRDRNIGPKVVPIIPDEARTFGIDGLFTEVGIYSSKGQLYEPVDKKGMSYYREAKNGQILEEGITEAGSMASFVAAGTAYANYGINMIPFYIYYSMFGPQRVGDEFWLAGDSRAKGFLLGATSGRTTLNGEGLQHQDGHSPLMASAVPTLYVYDPAFAYEIAAVIAEGMRRMFEEGEEIFYYLCLYNEDYPMPPMPAGVEEGIIKGLYKFKAGPEGLKHKAHLFGSGSIINSALRARAILAEHYDVCADVWSATSYKNLRNEALLAERWNLLHPAEPPKKPHVQKILEKESGPFIAVSDYMKMVPDQIAKWVPGGLTTLGTDGFGRSDTRPRLRRFFEIDAECVVVATLYALAQRGEIERKVAARAIKDLNIDPEKGFAQIVAF